MPETSSFQPVHFRFGNATAGFSDSGVSSTSYPGMTAGMSRGRAVSGPIRSRARVWIASADVSVPTTATPRSASSRIHNRSGSACPGEGPASSRKNAGTATSSTITR